MNENVRNRIPDQRKLWDHQHATRGLQLEGSDSLRFTPNATAVDFATHLQNDSDIVEVGCANGRDARYWATLGHTVWAIDFSTIALQQLEYLAMKQGLTEFVPAILWDISQGHLPMNNIPYKVDAFYARSALHINDNAMYQLAFELDAILAPGGFICVEGKGPKDPKIARSEVVETNLVLDQEESGHLRRVWTCEFARKLCEQFSWRILTLQDRLEEWNGIPATFMRLIAQK